MCLITQYAIESSLSSLESDLDQQHWNGCNTALKFRRFSSFLMTKFNLIPIEPLLSSNCPIRVNTLGLLHKVCTTGQCCSNCVYITVRVLQWSSIQSELPIRRWTIILLWGIDLRITIAKALFIVHPLPFEWCGLDILRPLIMYSQYIESLTLFRGCDYRDEIESTLTMLADQVTWSKWPTTSHFMFVSITHRRPRGGCT